MMLPHKKKNILLRFKNVFIKTVQHKKSKVNTLIYKQKRSEEKHQCVVPTMTTIWNFDYKKLKQKAVPKGTAFCLFRCQISSTLPTFMRLVPTFLPKADATKKFLSPTRRLFLYIVQKNVKLQIKMKIHSTNLWQRKLYRDSAPPLRQAVFNFFLAKGLILFVVLYNWKLHIDNAKK